MTFEKPYTISPFGELGRWWWNGHDFGLGGSCADPDLAVSLKKMAPSAAYCAYNSVERMRGKKGEMDLEDNWQGLAWSTRTKPARISEFGKTRGANR